jgi:hypothetical protein
MIVIIQNCLNKVVATLFEECITGTTEVFLFEVINKTTNNYYYTVVNDVSTSPDRYQQFCVLETSGTTDPYTGQINLPLAGQYDYNFYENPNFNLTPTGLNKVESGKLLVVSPPGTNSPPPAYQSNVNPNLQVYDATQYNNS